MEGLNFDSYQEFTDSVSVYNRDIYAFIPNEQGDKEGIPLPWIYPVVALSEEAGEVSGKIAKFLRAHGNDVPGLTTMVVKELGDVLFQLARVAREFDIPLSYIAEHNMDKLKDRQERGVIVGEGDSR